MLNEDRIKQTGEVFTPPELVNEILSKLPKEVWEDHSKTFLDPSCGDGAFLVRVVACKIKHRSTVKQALETTYGVELMPDNVESCREKLLSLAAELDNIEYLEALQKYGKIVGNPRTPKDQKGRIVCSDAFQWDFDKWCPKVSQEENKEENEQIKFFGEKMIDPKLVCGKRASFNIQALNTATHKRDQDMYLTSFNTALNARQQQRTADGSICCNNVIITYVDKDDLNRFIYSFHFENCIEGTYKLPEEYFITKKV